jgi:hypothetical protein
VWCQGFVSNVHWQRRVTSPTVWPVVKACVPPRDTPIVLQKKDARRRPFEARHTYGA